MNEEKITAAKTLPETIAEPAESPYVVLVSEAQDGRTLHLVRADWEKWGRPKTIEEFHKSRPVSQ